MPTFYDILIETETEVANRIADLCNERQEIAFGYDRAFAQCVTLEDAMALLQESDRRFAQIDREITVRTKAMRKLQKQIEVI